MPQLVTLRNNTSVPLQRVAVWTQGYRTGVPDSDTIAPGDDDFYEIDGGPSQLSAMYSIGGNGLVMIGISCPTDSDNGPNEYAAGTDGPYVLSPSGDHDFVTLTLEPK